MVSDLAGSGTHVLLSSSYPSALDETVVASRQFVTEARVCLRHDAITRDLPGAETCRQTWHDVQSSYTEIEGTDPFLDCDGQCYQLECTASTEPLAPLVETVTTVCGQHFLARLELCDSDGWRCRAIPSADEVLLNTDRPDGQAHLDAVNDSLADKYACFVPRDEQLVWTVDDATYSLKAGAVCVSRDRTETCYRVTRLENVSRTDSHDLRLEWQEPPTQTRLESVLETVRTAIGSRPNTIPCSDPETCAKAVAVLESWLECYRPRGSDADGETAT